MDIHKNARSCPRSRALLAERVLEHGWSLREAAEAGGLSTRRAREWVQRIERGESTQDRSSRPRTIRPVDPVTRQRVIELRREWFTMRQIAARTGISLASVSRICRKAELGRLKSLDPPPPVRRYECDHPGNLLHIDIKRLGRFDGVGHRITRKRSHGGLKQGWEFVYVATDDASRLSYAQILPDETRHSAIDFVRTAIRWFKHHGIETERIMTDNGSAFVSDDFKHLCRELEIRHTRIRPYRPQTNGKVERMIQTLLREWAYRFSYNSSDERMQWLEPYLHFYNFHRVHSALGYNPPISRLDKNNLLKRNS